MLKKSPFYFLLLNIFLFSSQTIMAGGSDTASSSSASSLSSSSIISNTEEQKLGTAISPSLLDEARTTYPVGTFSLELTDPKRKEIHVKSSQPIQRRIIIQLWYPAAEDKNSTALIARYKPLEDTIAHCFKKRDFDALLASKKRVAMLAKDFRPS